LFLSQEVFTTALSSTNVIFLSYFIRDQTVKLALHNSSALSTEMTAFKRAACIVLFREKNQPSAERYEVFLVERSPELAFMGGFHVFPGGTVDPEDHLTVQHPPLPGNEDRYGAALRELFEETGVLLATGAERLAASVRDQLRRHLLNHEPVWGEALKTHGLSLDTSALFPLGQWRTPPFGGHRFDALYLGALLPPGQEPSIWPGELSTGFWLSPKEAIARHLGGRCFITYPVLETFKVLRDCDADLSAASTRLMARGPDAYPHAGGEMIRGIHIIPLPSSVAAPFTHSNAFILGGQEAVVVDPGTNTPEGLDALTAYMTMLKERGTHFKGIWLSNHWHHHVAGAAELHRRFQLPISAHPLTEAALKGRLPIATNLNDNDVVSLKLSPGVTARWQILHTPGITPGHLAFHEQTLGNLLSGNLMIPSQPAHPDPHGPNPAHHQRSLKRLMGLKLGITFPGHGPSIAANQSVLKRALSRCGE
jgi:glyoxylase-like metal-dependent hydrolase (beta-lactamase superfamily II)/8-oxo-dGTP pyrophosphatase MutT (NUDIX family)